MAVQIKEHGKRKLPSLINCSSPFHTWSLSPIHWDLLLLEYSLEIQAVVWKWDMLTVTFLDMADIVRSVSSIVRGKCPQFLSATSEFCRKQRMLLHLDITQPSPAVFTHFLILLHVESLDSFCTAMPFPNEHPFPI